MKKKVTFIINPISGGKKKTGVPSMIQRIIDHDKYKVQIQFTKSAAHNLELAEQAVKENTDILVAVGGDGTINHIAKYVANSNTILGIVPQGSGNGLSRHLQIPMNSERALGLINEGKTLAIDSGIANDQFFINVAGLGFDAHVSAMFAKAPKRGFVSYSKISLNEFANYKSETFEMVIDGKTIEREAFILCVANGSQYGNNAFIAPTADVTDGVFEVSLLKPFKPHQLPIIGAQLFRKKFHQSKYIETFSGQSIQITRKNGGVVNIDGEPIEMSNKLNIAIQPKSLKIIIP